MGQELSEEHKELKEWYNASSKWGNEMTYTQWHPLSYLDAKYQFNYKKKMISLY